MLEVVTGDRVRDRVLGAAVFGVPPGGRTVQPVHTVGLLGGEPGPQRVGEEVVVAVPPPLVIEGDDEQVAALEDREHVLSVVPAGERVAQRAGQLVEDRRVEQEGASLFGLAVQDLLDEVVEDEAVASGERLDERRRRRRGCAATGPRAGDLPPIPRSGSPARRRDSGSRSRPMTSLRNAAASRCVKRRSAARSSSSSPRARRRATGSGGSARVVMATPASAGRWSSRNVISVVDFLGLDDVIVIERQHERPVETVQVVDQAHHDTGGHRGAVGLQECGRIDADCGAAAWTAAITLVRKRRGSLSSASSESQATRRDPACWAVCHRVSHWLSSVVLPNPAGAQTRTRRGSGSGLLRQLVDEPRTRDELAPRPRYVQLGTQQRHLVSVGRTAATPTSACGGLTRGGSNRWRRGESNPNLPPARGCPLVRSPYRHVCGTARLTWSAAEQALPRVAAMNSRPVPRPVDIDVVRDSYDRVADNYVDMVATTALGDIRTQPWLRAAMDVFADAVGGLGPVLDVGCGPGTVTAYLAERGLDVSGVDLSPRMIEHARRLHPECSFSVGSSTDLDLAEASWGGVLGWWSLFNLPRHILPQVLSSFARALVPGGQLIIGTHVGDGDVLRTEAYGGVPVRWTTYLWRPDQLVTLVEQAGLRPRPNSGFPPTDRSAPE